MSLNKVNLNKIILIFISCCLISYVHALPEDRSQPIHITSNTAIKDDQKGITVYQGDVKVDQGTMKIRADKVTFYLKDKKIIKVVAEGQPARFEQQPARNQTLVRARATMLEYVLSKRTVLLLDNAHLEQDGASITGDRITHNLTTARTKADSEKNGPVITIIPVEQLEDAQ